MFFEAPLTDRYLPTPTPGKIMPISLGPIIMPSIAFFDTHHYDRLAFEKANVEFNYDITFYETRLSLQTTPLADGFSVVCPFVNDNLDAEVLEKLAKGGTRLVALRAAGYNRIDLNAAARLGIKVVRVPAYSPYAVAEHAFALLLALVRKVHRAYARVRENNFSLEGLEGFDLHGKTFAVVGFGRIGQIAADIALGFGCKVMVFSQMVPEEWRNRPNVSIVENLADLYANADVISLHVPLTPETHHMINRQAMSQMKRGVILLNTSRGGLIDSLSLIHCLKSGRIGGVGMDVYELEEGVFFEDLSQTVLQDDVLARLTTFPNVLITSHQGFLTHEALANIADTTLMNIEAFEAGKTLVNEVVAG